MLLPGRGPPGEADELTEEAGNPGRIRHVETVLHGLLAIRAAGRAAAGE